MEGGKVRGGERGEERGREGGILSQSHPLSLHYFILPSLSPFLFPCLSLYPSFPPNFSYSNSTSPPATSSFLLSPSFPSSPSSPYSNFYLSINSPLYNFILNQVCNTHRGDLLFRNSQDKVPCFCSLNQTGSLAIVGYCGGVFKVCPSLFLLYLMPSWIIYRTHTYSYTSVHVTCTCTRMISDVLYVRTTDVQKPCLYNKINPVLHNIRDER